MNYICENTLKYFYFYYHLPVQIRDCKLDSNGKCHPEEVWDLDISDPLGIWPYRNHSPDEGDKDEQDVYRSQEIIFQAELEISEREIKNQIENKR